MGAVISAPARRSSSKTTIRGGLQQSWKHNVKAEHTLAPVIDGGSEGSPPSTPKSAAASGSIKAGIRAPSRHDSGLLSWHAPPHHPPLQASRASLTTDACSQADSRQQRSQDLSTAATLLLAGPPLGHALSPHPIAVSVTSAASSE